MTIPRLPDPPRDPKLIRRDADHPWLQFLAFALIIVVFIGSMALLVNGAERGAQAAAPLPTIPEQCERRYEFGSRWDLVEVK